MDIVLICVGVYIVSFSLIVGCKNIQSKIMFKVVPFFSGMFCIIYAIMNMGIININL